MVVAVWIQIESRGVRVLHLRSKENVEEAFELFGSPVGGAEIAALMSY